ncbi:hypothetical protein HMPREF1362_00592 [Enterococcus faecium ERV102]|nr:hypothetical protein HMPREF1362_00592 [Enterococcus faecium ERV102]
MTEDSLFDKLVIVSSVISGFRKIFSFVLYSLSTSFDKGLYTF